MYELAELPAGIYFGAFYCDCADNRQQNTRHLEPLPVDNHGEGGLIDKEQLQEKLSPYVVNQRVRTANRGDAHEELILEVKTRGELNLKVIDELTAVPGVETVNWVVESGETVG